VFLSLLLGWATATECAAWACSLAGDRLVAGRAVVGIVLASVMGATRVTCMIMLILAGASFMSTSMPIPAFRPRSASWVERCTSLPTR